MISFTLPGQTPDQLVPRNASVTQVTYHGRPAVQLIPAANGANGSALAILKNVSLQDGTVDVELAGKPASGAAAAARGFIGIAFRLRDNVFEYIYIRPTNGRADDQVRRNHSTQYASYPDFDFDRFRRESPEKYESYVDLQPGEWTKFRIEFEGSKARLYIHDAPQPVLIVNDLKLAPADGAIALWAGPGTEGYFSGLKVTPKSTRP